MPRDEEKAGAASPATPVVEAELAAYRNRLEEKLAARRAGTRPGAALGGAQRPVATGATAGTARASSLLAKALVAAVLGASVVCTGVLAWPLLPDRPALGEARAALVIERARNLQQADELRAAMLALKAKSLAVADHAAREAQIEQLREELKRAGEIAVMRDHFAAVAGSSRTGRGHPCRGGSHRDGRYGRAGGGHRGARHHVREQRPPRRREPRAGQRTSQDLGPFRRPVSCYSG